MVSCKQADIEAQVPVATSELGLSQSSFLRLTTAYTEHSASVIEVS
jgi:hypothetical protein